MATATTTTDIAKLDPVVIESVIAPLRQDRPFVGGFSHHAMPVIRPGVLRRPLKVGESRIRSLQLSQARLRRCAGREQEQEQGGAASSVKHGHVLSIKRGLWLSNPLWVSLTRGLLLDPAVFLEDEEEAPSREVRL
jgi:hypothetical protein